MLLAIQTLLVTAASVLAAFGTALFISAGKTFAVCADGAVQTYLTVVVLTISLAVLFLIVTMAIGWLASFTNHLQDIIHVWTIVLISTLFVEGIFVAERYGSNGMAAIIVAAGTFVLIGEMFLVVMYAEAIARRSRT